MTVGFSTTNVANGVLNALRDGGAAYGPPTDIFVKLHTGDPGSAGANNAAAGDTSRKAAAHAAASGGSMALSANVGPWTNGGTSETISHISVWDAVTGGNFLYSATLTASQAWVSTNTFTLTVLTLNVTPLAA